MRLAHGWELIQRPGFPAAWMREFVLPAMRAVPGSLAARLGSCRVTLLPTFDDPARTSEWTCTGSRLVIRVASLGEGHDVALEALTCLGQALWERLSGAEESTYWRLLDAEILAQVSGEIDEQALDAKRLLLSDRRHAGDPQCLAQYGLASFAATAAEYVHCFWHDVTIRTGEEYLPARQLRRRLELLAQWFPPDPGYTLFPAPSGSRYGAGAAASCAIGHRIRR